MVVFSTTVINASFIANALLRLQLPFLLLLPRSLLLLWLLLLRCQAGAARCERCCFLLFWFSLAPMSFFSTSPPLPLRLGSGSLRPCRHHKPVRLPFWLLARFVDGLAPFACVVRCSHGSTMRFSTMSCVYSTHRSLHALNFPSWLQRISLAMSTLLLIRALPGPQPLFPLLAPLEPLLLSLALPALSSLPLLSLSSLPLCAPPALSSLPLAPPALSSLPLAPPALSSLPPLAPPALSFLSLLSLRLLYALNRVVSRSSVPLAQSFVLFLSLSLVLSSLPPVFRPQSAHLISLVSLVSGTDMAWGCEPPAPMLGAIRPRCPSWASSFFCIISTNFLTSSLWFSSSSSFIIAPVFP